MSLLNASPLNASPAIVLASASPRRTELLAALGVAHIVRPADIDETRLALEAPLAYVERLAEAKAVAFAHPGEVVLGADTIVVLDRDVLGKPRDADDARTMLGRLSGRTHTVHTGVAVLRNGVVHTRVATSHVTFSTIAAWAIERYLATGEPFDKAGAYGIQGPGAQFVCGLTGSLTNVRGLPVELLPDLLPEVFAEQGSPPEAERVAPSHR